jgi:hypothetical protein
VNSILAEPFPAVAVAVVGAAGRPLLIVHDPAEFEPVGLPQLLSPGPFAFTALR